MQQDATLKGKKKNKEFWLYLNTLIFLYCNYNKWPDWKKQWIQRYTQLS
jgi:hypothetical protein